MKARKKTRERADGTVYEWWEVRVPTGERQRSKSISAKTKREAEAKAREFLKQAPDIVPATRRSVGEAVVQNSPKVEAGEGTIKRRLEAWARHAGKLADMKLDRLSIAKAREWRNALPRSRDADFALEAVRIALDFEVGGRLRMNPFRSLPRRPRRKPTDTEGVGAMRLRVFSQEEVRRLKDAARGTRHGALVHVLFDLGLRPGEALGLMWGDLEASENVLHVRRCVTEEGGGRNVRLSNVLKTERSRRDLFIPDSTITALGHPGPDDALIFPNAKGGPLSKTRVYKLWAAWHHKAEVELVERRSLHSCRHTLASALIDAGVPVPKVADVLGDTVETVQKFYAHAARDGREVEDVIRRLAT